MRIEPGILLSGSPPSKPWRSAKRATRRIIFSRDTPRRGSVSIGSSVWFGHVLESATYHAPETGQSAPTVRRNHAILRAFPQLEALDLACRGLGQAVDEF